MANWSSVTCWRSYDILLPSCPMVQTPSDGRHRYFLVPKWLPIRSSISLWGIDILAAGSNVILPGSRTEAGVYRALRSFEECPIPEAPPAFVKLIRNAQKRRLRPVKKSSGVPDGDNSPVSRRQWYLLFRNKVLRSFWDLSEKTADTSLSAYEYHLAKACFCCGFNRRQTVYVIQKWW